MTQAFRLEAVQLQGVGVFDNTLIRFKPIESTEQDEKLAEIHLFTGPNGCGKSTLLYALAEIFDEFCSPPKSLIRFRFRNAESRVDFLFDRQTGQYGSKKSDTEPATGNNRFGSFRWLYDSPSQGQVFGYGNELGKLFDYKNWASSFQLNNRHNQFRFSFAAFAYSGQRTLRNEILTSIQELTNSPFEAALSFDNTSRPKVLLQWIANNRVKYLAAKDENDLKTAADCDLALVRITDLIREVCDMEVDFRFEYSKFNVAVRVNGDSIQFDCLPDGLKSIISWVADLSLRLEAIPWEVERDIFSQSIILFLDEVDIHLHPKWQRRILPAIQRLLPNAQIFVSTHSPFVVGSVDNAWVYRLPEPGTKKDRDTKIVSVHSLLPFTGSEAILTATSAGETHALPRGNECLPEIEGEPSNAGKSYRLILDEIFGIDKEFGVETEALFDKFYQARAVFLKTPTNSNADEAAKIAGLLAARGVEAATIVAMELRQMSRVTGVEVSLA